MSGQPNPFLDPNDGHVLADDAEKNRHATEYGHGPPRQSNPFTSGAGIPIMSAGLGFSQGLKGNTIGPLPRAELA